MFFVSDIYTTTPASYQTPLQEKTYQALAALKIPYQRVETDEAITMEDCVQINAKLQMKMVKTLFLCNRQQTAFYLFVTAGDKPFHSKDFSNALGVARVSFAPAEYSAPCWKPPGMSKLSLTKTLLRKCGMGAAMVRLPDT